MEDKMGMALDEIHISGRVPQCELLDRRLGVGTTKSFPLTNSVMLTTHQTSREQVESEHGTVFQTDGG